jgi:hypothetical protein
VAEVVREARRVDEVGVAAERAPELAADLGALERVGQAGARDGDPGAARLDDLRLAGQAPERPGVQHPRPVALERRAPGAGVRLRDEPGQRLLVVGRHPRRD